MSEKNVFMQRIITAYTRNVYMLEKNVFMQHIRTSFTHICVVLVAYTCKNARIRVSNRTYNRICTINVFN